MGPPRLARHVEAEHDDTRRAESHDMHNFAMLKRVSGAPVGTGQQGLEEGHFGQDEVRDGQWSVQKLRYGLKASGRFALRSSCM